jgi:hypothetical protein
MAHQLTQSSEVTILDPDGGFFHAPASGITFTNGALRTIATQSRGIPRAINMLCDRALEIAQDRAVTRIDWRIMRAASRRVHVRNGLQLGFRTVTKAAVAAAAVMLLAILGFGVRTWGTERLPETSPPPPFARVNSPLMVSKSLDLKSLPAADSFNVRVASFRVAGSAAALAGQLQAEGLPAFVRVERGTVHQVIVGPYLAHGEIAGVQARLARHGYSGDDVFIESFAQSGDDAAGGLMARSPRFAR